MCREEEIIQVFDSYETAGLVEADSEKVLSLISEDIMGFGMGEQGFVSSKDDVRAIVEQTVKKDPDAVYRLKYEEVHVRLMTESSANLCGKVYVYRESRGKVTTSGFMQSLSFIRQNGKWLICALHASPLTLTEESIESYPLTFADSALAQLRTELREESFQFLSKSLSVGILGAYVDAGDLPPFYVNETLLKMLGYSEEEFYRLMATNSFAVVHPEDQERAQRQIGEAIEQGPEYTCPYRLVNKKGESVWIVEHGRQSVQEGRKVILSAFVDVTELMKLQFALKEKNETILSSINYASRIQKNLLPAEQRFGQAFSDYSVLWSPKDIVGGDIYWLKTFPEGTVLCVCDCTGHGIPGALLTVLVSTSLDSIVNRENCSDTARILFEMDQRGAEVLYSHAGDKGSILNIRDGGDLAVVFVAREGSVTFSSANVPVFLCDGEQVRRYKGQRLRIGEGALKTPDQVESVRIPASSSNAFYVASDGLFDQVGGPDSRPFGCRTFQRLLLENHHEKQAVVSRKIWEAFEKHRGTQIRRDDMELVSFRP